MVDPESLLKELHEKSDPKTKQWWEGYVKESAPFLGVKMADIRAVLHRWYAEQNVDGLAAEEQFALALRFFEGRYTEEKLAGTLFLQEILLPANAISCSDDIKRFEGLFVKGYIYDWNVCDWFCVKVLGALIKKDGFPCADKISTWRGAQNLWQSRASLVAFVPVADNNAYYPLIESSCETLIRRKERFAKTAVGWILRDISKYDQAFVDRVVTGNIGHFSAESLNNATKYYSKAEKNQFRQMLKSA